MAHNHDVYDTGKHFEINGTSRFIKETSSTKLVLVQGDHKSEVITFQMPRYIDGHDMLLCNKIRVHYINIETTTNNKSADIYEVTDLALCEECEDVLTFTWTIEAPATKYFGNLSFLIKFECTEGENILYQWNTAKYVGTNVLAGMDNSEEFVDKYSNVLEEWYNELTSGADSIEELNQQAIAEIELAKEDAKEDIQGKANSTMAEMNQFSSNAYNSFKNDVDKKARETLESIPEDYTETDSEVKGILNVLDFHKNYLTASDFSTGYYSLTSLGVIKTNSSNEGYKKAKIENIPSGKYVTLNLRACFCIIEDLLTGEKIQVMNTDSVFSGVITLNNPSNLYLTLTSTVENFYFLEGESVPENGLYNTGYSERLNILEKGSSPTITVEKDGSGDYTRLIDAIDYATEHANTKIYIGAGIYDLIEEFGDDYFNNLGAVGRSGLKLCNNMHLIFSSNSKVVCNYLGDNENVMGYFSPFNMCNESTGFTLENLNLECANVRYCVHDEVNSEPTPYRNYYKNCRMKIDNSQNTAWNARQCIGGGIGVGEIIIENCYFESTPTTISPSGDIVTYHNGNADGIQSNIIITGCYFAGQDGCRCSHFGSHTEVSHMLVSNCSMGREPRVIFESNNFNVENFELKAWNNEIRQL